MTTPRLLLGSHQSTSGRLDKSLERGRDVGCDCIQIFVKNPNRWKSPPFDDEAIAAFRAMLGETGIAPVFAHAIYLLNLGTTDDELWHKSIDALVDDLERCEQLDLPGLVIHPGSHKGAGEAVGLARISQGLEEVHRRLPGHRAQVWLENTAGQGDHLGYTFEQLRGMIDCVREPERLGICFDTCHAFAAGYELRTREGYEATWSRFDAVLGLERLKAIHLNDSKRELGSRVDRHDHIGHGQLGLEPFRCLLNDPRFRGIPMTLETDKGPDLEEDRENLRILRSLVEDAG
ncbi:MAG TPA: deoxyribonuclease IV [Anaerolineae bacterium]|nr:deoxyribonuclease IV [Anaerolineae bacterium]